MGIEPDNGDGNMETGMVTGKLRWDRLTWMGQINVDGSRDEDIDDEMRTGTLRCGKEDYESQTLTLKIRLHVETVPGDII